MAARPLVQINVPPPPSSSRQNNNNNITNCIPGVKSFPAEKALRFTPFVQSVLPLVDRIEIPEPSRVRENGRIATSSERTHARQVCQQQDLSAAAQTQVAKLLNQDGLIFLDFKLGPAHPTKQPRPNYADLGLSPMARSILNMTNVGYQLPSPDSNQSHHAARKPNQLHAARLPTPAESKSPARPSRPVDQQTVNGVAVTKQQNTGIVVQIPPPAQTFRREEYPTLGSPKRRKLSADAQDYKQNRSEKQQSDSSLQSFTDFLNDIFAAQDAMDSSGFANSGATPSAFFDLGENDTADEICLNTRTLDRLQDDLKRLCTSKRLKEVSVTDLSRLQKLCEMPIEQSQTTFLGQSSDSDEDLASWKAKLLFTNKAICSAIVALYTMVGNPQQETLISTDTIRWSSLVIVNVLENCLIPIIEARPATEGYDLFKQASHAVDLLKQLLSSSRRLLDLLSTVCTDVNGGDTCLNAIEFLAAKLIFVQNATSEKTSALGVQIYETFRRYAMGVLSKLYARFPRERSAILDEVLSSLDKLPSTSRSARTFRIGEGKSIQLISALFMQLVQTTAMEIPVSKKKPKSRKQKPDEEDVAEQSHDDSTDEDSHDPTNLDPVARLDRKVDLLFQPASRSAQDVVLYLVAKASKTTKTGDSPYRNILDLLIEDLINVLDNFEWPSAELLLNVLAVKMLDLAKNEKTASAKNMALESLGVMGSAISRLRAKLPHTIGLIRDKDGVFARELIRLADGYNDVGGVLPQDLIALNGPFVAVATHLSAATRKKSLQQYSAQSYFAAHFASLVSQTAHTAQIQVDLSAVLEHVLAMIATTSSYPIPQEDVSRDVAEAAFLFCILHLRFCRRLADIVKALSSSLSSDQAQVRSRSLKSVSTVLEIDPSLLDRDQTIADDVFRCASDDSAMVRDSALSLIARFIIPRGGALEKRGIERLLQCAGDEKVGVQKRSIGHLKEIYLQDQRAKVKALITRTLFRRLTDPEESIVSLTQQTLEDILIKPALVPFNKEQNSAIATVAVEELAMSLMAFAEDEPQTHMALLKRMLIGLLKSETKTSSSAHRLCGRLVHILFEKIMDKTKVKSPLLVLTALSEADPKLVAPLQLAKLQIYLTDIQTEADLFMFRAAVGIFGRVLPDLSETHKSLLKEIQDRLMQSISKLARRLELDAVMACLNSIDGTLQNTERLLRLSSSVLNQLDKPNVQQPQLIKLLQIAGAMGKNVDLDKSFALFQRMVPDCKARSVSAYVVQRILPLASKASPHQVRLVAMESLGSVCIANSSHFNTPRVRSTFFDLLKLPGHESTLEENQLKTVILGIFDELYAARAASKEASEKSEDGGEPALKVMGGDTRSRDQDSAISAVTMTVTDAVLSIGLSEASDNALPAAKTLASISHQGLIHPKQCLGAFVAFGTSKNPAITAVGYKAQKLLHEQHESHCEREYISAISQAYQYQRDVDRSPYGANPTSSAGFSAKLERCFEIVNVSNSKYVKKFLSGVVSRTTFDAADSQKPMPSTDHVDYTRFIVQNIAFFSYRKLDELLHVVLQLELAYSKSGGEIAAQIEAAEQKYPDMMIHKQLPGNVELGLELTTVAERTTDPALLVEMRRLSTAASTLMLLIEARSHLIRQYGLGRDVRVALANSKQAKDTNKTANKVHGITGDKFWTRSNNAVKALGHEEGILQICKEFVAAMSAEDDFEMADEGGLDGIIHTIDPESHRGQRTGTPMARKRKLSTTPGTTPSKRQRGRPKRSLTRRSSSVSTGEDLDADFDD